MASPAAAAKRARSRCVPSRLRGAQALAAAAASARGPELPPPPSPGRRRAWSLGLRAPRRRFPPASPGQALTGVLSGSEETGGRLPAAAVPRCSYRRLPPGARGTCRGAAGAGLLSPFRGLQARRAAGSAAPPRAPWADGEGEAPRWPGTSRPTVPAGPGRPPTPPGAGGDAGRALPSYTSAALAGAAHGCAVRKKGKRQSWAQRRRAGPGDRLGRGEARGGPGPGPGPRPGAAAGPAAAARPRSRSERNLRPCLVRGSFYAI